jgi:NADH-quinone oxidoreductase subunit J
MFFLFSSIAVGGALGVVLGPSPIASLLFMIASLASTAGIYVLLEAHFLAAIQIIVYAGAIMVLFLFVIMLLNLGHDYKKDIRGGLAVLLGFAVTGSIGGLLANQLGINDSVLMNFSDVGVDVDVAIAEKGIIGVIAEPLFTEYLVAFEFTGVLLFVAIVGAVVLAKKAD